MGGGDIMRNIQLLPGVDATNDLDASLNVRGSGSDENMVMLDGIKLYNVDHFYGIFNAIYPEIIEEVNFYKNTFPIEYSGITASVVEMNSRSLNEDQFDATFQVDFITISGLVDLPLNDQMSIVLAGRTSHQDVANSSFFEVLQSNREQVTTAFDDTFENFNRPVTLPSLPVLTFTIGLANGIGPLMIEPI